LIGGRADSRPFRARVGAQEPDQYFGGLTADRTRMILITPWCYAARYRELLVQACARRLPVEQRFSLLHLAQAVRAAEDRADDDLDDLLADDPVGEAADLARDASYYLEIVRMTRSEKENESD